MDVHGLDDFGFVYYPYTCITGLIKCKVHIFLNGCSQQYTGPTGDLVIMKSGWNDYAASNNLIIIYL